MFVSFSLRDHTTMTEETLFIGGSHDGTRHQMDELPSVVHLIKKMDSVPRHSPFRHLPQLDEEIEEYKLTPFRGLDDTYYVYAIKTLTASDVIAHLISKYPTQEV